MRIGDIRRRKGETHSKGWGSELWIANTPKYCGKLLRFNEGSRFSMHYHMEKEETFFILEGALTLFYYDLSTAEEKSILLKKGDIIDIPVGNPHQLLAETDAAVIEISTQHFDEDSYRVRKGDSQK